MGSCKKLAIMRNNYNIFLFIGVSYIGSVLMQGNSGCCLSKTVGTESYTLLNETAARDRDLDCLSPCIYMNNDQPGSRFCFKSGPLPVTCNDDNVYPFSITNKLNQTAIVGFIFIGDDDIEISLDPNQTEEFRLNKIPAYITAKQGDVPCGPVHVPKEVFYEIVGNQTNCQVRPVFPSTDW